ncbi:TraR/DksA C4-type zinc finger protein [Salipaludibacillus keqinensis]|nr:TraR/DksA C4-type zinc finger protein [Salipaludibacillus keqinensis]
MYEDLKKQLEKDKQDILKQIEQEATYTSDKMNDPGELSHVDNHPADEATELYDREKDMAIRKQWEKHLQEIEIALNKMEKGTYGICEKTGQSIPYERLIAQPTATTVVLEEERTRSVPNDRPVEEAAMNEMGQGYYSNYMDEDTSPDDESTGYTEELEGFLSTGMNGFEGSDRVTFHRNKQYEHYIEERQEE